MDFEKIWLAICQRLQEFYLKAFGSEDNSWSDSRQLPADSAHQWQNILQMNVPCILVLRNTEATGGNVLEFTFNKSAPAGVPMNPGDVITLDNVTRIVYARPLDPTKTCKYAYATIGLITS